MAAPARAINMILVMKPANMLISIPNGRQIK